MSTATLNFAQTHANKIPLTSLEGFVRQIIGWREFVRAVYLLKGSQQRSTNFWGHTRKLPESFYTATTGVEPVDTTIRRLQKHAYTHHIERLMVLGNFMLLCEIDPDEVYRWFMEMFIDAYDWVMVPNIYGMNQYADGGLMTTKPYISSSKYILRMSDYEKGSWCDVWNSLYWRFINKHRDVFRKNPRMSFMVSAFDRMPDEKRNTHLSIHLVFHPYGKSSPVEGLGSSVQPGFTEGFKGPAKGFSSVLFGFNSTIQAAHHFKDKDLSFLFEEIIALFGKGKLSFKHEQIRFGRCDIQLSHRAILPGYAP